MVNMWVDIKYSISIHLKNLLSDKTSFWDSCDGNCFPRWEVTAVKRVISNSGISAANTQAITGPAKRHQVAVDFGSSSLLHAPAGSGASHRKQVITEASLIGFVKATRVILFLQALILFSSVFQANVK